MCRKKGYIKFEFCVTLFGATFSLKPGTSTIENHRVQASGFSTQTSGFKPQPHILQPASPSGGRHEPEALKSAAPKGTDGVLNS